MRHNPRSDDSMCHWHDAQPIRAQTQATHSTRRSCMKSGAMFIVLMVFCIAQLGLAACSDDNGTNEDMTAMDASELSDDMDALDDGEADTQDADDLEDADVSDDEVEGPRCGNGIAENDEECDGKDRLGTTCESVTGTVDAVGQVFCTETCELDTAECEAVECGMNEELIGGGCVPANQEPYAPANTWSYVSYIDLAPEAPQPPCCFDLDNDGTIDNSLKDLLGGVLATGQADLDLTDAMNEAIASGELTILVEYRDYQGLPGSGEAVGISLFRGISDIDDDGMPDDDFQTREAGDGIYQIDPESLASYGSVSQFNRAEVNGDELTGNWGRWELDVVVPDTFALKIPVEWASVRFQVTEETTGLFSVNEEVDVNGTPVSVAQAEIGGVVYIQDFVDVVNGLVGECSCAGVEPGDVLLKAEELDGELAISCTDLEFEDSACTQDPAEGGGFVCPQLQLLCGASTVLSQLPDIDTNGNGIPDALSAGIRLELVGATLNDPAIP